MNRSRVALAAVLTASTLTGPPRPADAQEAYWPGSEWRTATPESQGIDSDGLANTVYCREGFPTLDAAGFRAAVSAHPWRANYRLGGETPERLCATWRAGEAETPDPAAELARIRAPSLVLAGELDPVVPVRWAEQRFGGGLGVMMDDVIAGALGALTLAVALTASAVLGSAG